VLEQERRASYTFLDQARHDQVFVVHFDTDSECIRDWATDLNIPR
jgi:hypothetical protein